MVWRGIWGPIQVTPRECSSWVAVIALRSNQRWEIKSVWYTHKRVSSECNQWNLVVVLIQVSIVWLCFSGYGWSIAVTRACHILSFILASWLCPWLILVGRIGGWILSIPSFIRLGWALKPNDDPTVPTGRWDTVILSLCNVFAWFVTFFWAVMHAHFGLPTILALSVCGVSKRWIGENCWEKLFPKVNVTVL